MSTEDLEKEHAAALERAMKERVGRSKDSDWALARALIHRAVHLVAEQKAAEYCAVATHLAEMIGHAHQLLHPADAKAPGHGPVH